MTLRRACCCVVTRTHELSRLQTGDMEEEEEAGTPASRKANKVWIYMKLQKLRNKLHAKFNLQSWSSEQHRPLFSRGWKLRSSVTSARVMHLPSPPPVIQPRNPKAPPPHPYSFVKPHYTVASTAGVRTAVTVERQGSIEEKSLVSVVVCASGSDSGVPAAVVGVDFLLMHSHVTFQPGKRSASVPLLILANPQGYVLGSNPGVGRPGIHHVPSCSRISLQPAPVL